MQGRDALQINGKRKNYYLINDTENENLCGENGNGSPPCNIHKTIPKGLNQDLNLKEKL